MLKYNYVINLTRHPDRWEQFLKNKNIMNDIVLRRPIDRIIVFRPPTHPVEIYDML
jgi:hypothetical protein